MTENGNAPPAARAMELLAGFARSQVLHALVSGGVLEELRAEAKSVADVARARNLNADVLARTLRFAALFDVVELRDGKVTLGEVGRCFLQGPGTLAISATFIGAPPWRDSWANFPHALRTGEPAFDAVMGQPYFTFLSENQQYGKPFNDYMTAMTQATVGVVVGAYDFGGFSTICDVGGGQGLLLRSVLEAAPKARGILLDLASALEHHVLAGHDRATTESGSFFERVPAADCYLLKTVLHDWNDEQATRILRNCRQALRPGGKVVVIEQVIDETPSAMALFYDLHMQVMLGGKERTADDFARLFDEAGLRLSRILPTPSPLRLVEATLAAR